jgi:NAD(P)-dependent dehydrogenase (short-subunit alcohol dehydrogenase family)
VKYLKDFKDKVAVITGGASGIGLGIAKRAVKEGMKVVIADIDEEALSKAEVELKELGGTVLSVLTDVSKAEDVETLAQKTLDTFGEVRLLCNNAGVGVGGLLWEFTLNDWKYVINVNLWGVIHGIRNFVPIMLKQDNECHIVNTASFAGLTTEPLQGIYNVTKHGVVALSESLWRELKNENSKIQVSVLCPGFVNTNILITSFQNRQAELRDREIDEKTAREELLEAHPQYETYLEMWHRMFEEGLSPDKAGDIVFEAVKDEAFYILTDTSFMWKRMVKRRLDRVLKAFKTNKPYTRETIEVF